MHLAPEAPVGWDDRTAKLVLMQNSEDITRVERALLFLHRIGIPLRRTGERAKSFLPGVWIEGGTLMYNLEDLRYRSLKPT